MSYSYEAERPQLFTESGQRQFLAIRDRVQALLKQAGAVRLGNATRKASGSSWTHIACIDRMVELGEIREVTIPGAVWAQHRVFVSARGDA